MAESKMHRQTWDSLPRQSKLAAVLWPELVPNDIQREMRAISKGEGKTSPMNGKLVREKAYREQAAAKNRRSAEGPRYTSPRWWDEK